MADELEPRELELPRLPPRAPAAQGHGRAHRADRRRTWRWPTRFLQTSVYEGTAEVLVRPPTSESIVNPNADRALAGADAQSTIDTEIKVLQSRAVENAVRKKLGRVPVMSASTRPDETDVIADPRAKHKCEAGSAWIWRRTSTRGTYLEVHHREVGRRASSRLGKRCRPRSTIFQRQLDTLGSPPPPRGHPEPRCAAQQPRAAAGLLPSAATTNSRCRLQISQSGGGQVVSEAVTPGSPGRAQAHAQRRARSRPGTPTGRWHCVRARVPR